MDSNSSASTDPLQARSTLPSAGLDLGSDAGSDAGNSDEVDGIVSSWQIQRPDLNVTPMAVFSRVLRLARHLDLARKTAFAAHDMASWEFDVLSSLRRAGHPYALTPGQLMQESLVSSGTMTNRIDRLEEKGLLKRAPHPEDRRAVLVSLTAAGRKRIDGALETLLAEEAALLGGLDESQAQQLAALLRQLLLPFDRA